ncbi:hypothetical protein M885DRAFT_619713 [Pelagophyceae sp. CCMP2097]|nr:hypothetical protein M885DRAFT_619713 [Pelagophyceae sp. CCMP2097]
MRLAVLVILGCSRLAAPLATKGFGAVKASKKPKAAPDVPSAAELERAASVVYDRVRTEAWWAVTAPFDDAGFDAPAAARARLAAWLLASGGRLADGVALRPTEAGGADWGLVCAAPVLAGARVLAVPRKCVVTSDLGARTVAGRSLAAVSRAHGAGAGDAEAVAANEAALHLALFLLEDRNDAASRFRPFHASLPRTFPGHPIFWGPAQLAEARGSSLQTQVQARRKALAEAYSRICAACPAFQADTTMAQFAWASTAVESRNFDVDVDGKRTTVMVPAADMANHASPSAGKSGAHLGWAFDAHTETFVFRATDDIHPPPEGMELCLDYGVKCNSRFLISYGFCVDGNVEVSGACPDTATLVLQLGDAVATWKVSANYDEGLAKFLTKLRSLFPLDLAAVQKLAMRGDGSYAAIPPEADREREVLGALADISASYLDAMPNPETISSRDARVFVQGERCVLAHLIDFAAKAAALIDALEGGADDADVAALCATKQLQAYLAADLKLMFR